MEILKLIEEIADKIKNKYEERKEMCISVGEGIKRKGKKKTNKDWL